MTMAGTLPELAEQYVSSFQSYLRGSGESALRQAYELGRRALMEGLGVLELTVLYHQALGGALRHTLGAAENSRVVEAGETFFLESLAPFEMTHRGVRETHVLLQDSDERYRELFDNASDIVFTTDLSGNVLSINPAGEQATGYLQSEIPLLNLSQMVAPEYRKLVHQMLQGIADGARPAFHELEIASKDGRRRVPVEISSRAILRDGEVAGMQGIARDITERRLARQALRGLNEALEEEARRIAHAIHDEAGQLLASVHIALEDLANDNPQQLGKKIPKVKELLYEIEEQLRRLSHELRPTILDDLGIRPALEFLAAGVARRTGLDIKLEFSLEGRLAPSAETALYRITQEALTNVNKHAQAKQVWIQMQTNGDINCSIRDDGKGFDVDYVFKEKGRMGLGLRGMQERLAALGGNLVIASAPGQGTALFVNIPNTRHNGA